MFGFMALVMAIQFYVTEPNYNHGCQENTKVKCEYRFNR
jgi:hypothetical protein